MAGEGDDIQKLTERIDALVQVNERLIRALSQSSPSTADPAPANGPIQPLSSSLLGSTSPSLPVTGRARRNTQVSAIDLDSIRRPSLFTGEESSESEDDESFFVQDTLPPESFAEEDLKHHLKTYEFDAYGQMILQEILEDPRSLENALLVPPEADLLREHATYLHANVCEVGGDGSALTYNVDTKDASEAFWQSLSNTNADKARQRKAVGKIIIVREPSALLFGAVHLTMNGHFDVDQLFRLLTDKTETKAYVKGCLKTDPRQQRSFVFSFKYHCIIGEGRQPKAWQKSDGDLTSNREHIPISTCSSIVALSLSGKPANTLRRRSRKAKTIVGQIYDPFAPWRLLSIQCFPDWETTVDVHDLDDDVRQRRAKQAMAPIRLTGHHQTAFRQLPDPRHYALYEYALMRSNRQNRHYVNGTEAFLVTVLAEYKDAQKRLREINERIVALVTPPPTLMFDGKLRDKLLFEDKGYTYSRRYFWAFQTLATMNDSIEAMIATYKETFTDEVWTGEHKYIWPGTRDHSSRYSNWRKKMASLRKEFETTIADLQGVLALNIKEQKDIKSLRDQLFSGTSVKESREAIRQNDNIKLLTLVTIFFLPLTFVTSIFGMTNMPQQSSFIHFAIATATICIPSYLLIFSLSSDMWQERYKAMFHLSRQFLARPLSRHRINPERSSNWWSRFWEPELQPTVQRQRQSRSVTAYEDRASRNEKLALPVSQQENERPSVPPPTTVDRRPGGVQFDVSSFDRRPRLERPEKNLSPPGPLCSLPEENISAGSTRKRGLFRSISDRISGQNSPKSPV